MPRDFVPCLYYERIEAQPETSEPVLCCDVIELFATSWRHTREPDVVASNNSHQFSIRDSYIGLPPDEIPVRLRAPLFAHFYAAMAALE